MSNEQIFAIFIIVFIVLCIKGAIKTFRRSPVVAILMLIFLGPLWMLWAFIEIFTGEIKEKVVYVKQIDD
jgi:hypothetical protein